MTKQELGVHGESLATEFLLSKGYEVLERNVRRPLFEVDIVCRDGAVVVLVEVRARVGGSHPLVTITPAKQRKLLRAMQFIAAKYRDRDIRLDAVTLYWKHISEAPTISHFENIL